MSTHIPYLELLLILMAIIFPTGFGTTIGMAFSRRRGYSIFFDNLGLVIAYALIVVILYFLHFKVNFSIAATQLALLGVLGIAGFYLEYLVGILAFYRKNHRFPQNAKLATMYSSYKKITFFDIISIFALVCLEEIVLRGVLFSVFTQMGLNNIYAVGFLMIIIYAINHITFGLLAVVQKLCSGTIFVLLFFIARENLCVPIVAHLVFNFYLLWYSRKSSAKGATS